MSHPINGLYIIRNLEPGKNNLASVSWAHNNNNYFCYFDNIKTVHL